MGWLVPYFLVAAMLSWIVVKVFDHIFAGLSGGLVNSARAGLFIGTWAAVTTMSGMRGFTGKVRRLRRSNANARDRLDALMKRDGRKV